jgi:hypothetical protein
MKKREIIIVMLAGILVLYGLLDFFVFSGKPENGEDEKIAGQLSGITAFAESAGSELAAVAAEKEFPDMDYLVSRIESEWPHDPFVADGSAGIQAAVSDLEAPKLAYTGFIKAGKKILAVINGMEYEIGELLKDVGYKVSGITPSRVVLLTELNKEIILQLEEN